MKIVNSELVKGVFPHKGERCYKVVHWGLTCWVPVSDAILAETMPATCSYVFADLLEEADLVHCQVDTGLTGRKLAYPRKFVRLAEDWPADRSSGPCGPHRAVPAGSQVYLAGNGSPSSAAVWWVIPPAA
jgi:hypothetical protein